MSYIRTKIDEVFALLTQHADESIGTRDMDVEGLSVVTMLGIAYVSRGLGAVL